MIDSSSFIGYEHFRQELEFVKNNIRYYNINPQCTQVSIVTYSTGVYNQFYLNGYNNQAALLSAIDNIKYQSGGSNTGDVINYISGTSFTSAHGGRVGVPRYGVLVTGSSSANPAYAVSAAKNATANGINLFTVGVGNGYSQTELKSIASGTKNEFYSQNFNSLNTVAEPLATRLNGGNWVINFFLINGCLSR